MRRSLLIAVLFLLAVPAGSAATRGLYSDARADNGSAPDITHATIATTATSFVFTLDISGLERGADQETLLVLDTDRNPETGDRDALGAEYMVAVTELTHTYWVGRWAGDDWIDADGSGVSVMSPGYGYRIAIDRAALGAPTGFHFWLRTIAGDVAPPGRYDDAPDEGTWDYLVADDGPEIRGVLVTTTPAAGPRAGRSFAIAPLGIRLAPDGEELTVLPKPARYDCRARAGGATLRGTRTGGCTWRVPKGMRGKPLAITMTVSYQGATKSFRFLYRIA